MNIEGFKVTIVGLGVIGGAFAQALKLIGASKVYGIDICEATLKKAKILGFIDDGYTDGSVALPESDLVIVALYPDSLEKFILDNNQFFKKNSIITDTLGIKNKISETIKPLVRNDVDFILGHPMAGKEKKGIEFADMNVFKNANYILIRDNTNKKENLEFLESLIYKIGFKNINYLTTQEHDEIVAFTSQLTHILAVTLINSDTEKYNTAKFIGDSYRDLTRIAKINEVLWTELFLGNKSNLINMIENFENKLSQIKNYLINDDKEQLQKEFITSTKRREKLDKKYITD